MATGPARALGPLLREFIVIEADHALGRADERETLAAVTTGEEILAGRRGHAIRRRRAC